LSTLQFFCKPVPILFSLNIIDLCFLLYGFVFLFIALILPQKSFSLRMLFMNSLFLLLHLLGFPLIFVSRLCRELESRMGLPLQNVYRIIEQFIYQLFNGIWTCCFREPITIIDTHREDSMLSINIIMKDLPCFGIFLSVVVGTILFTLLNSWGNPATPETDSYLLAVLKTTILKAIEPFGNHFLQLVSLSIVISFASEFLSNTALILMFTPLAGYLAAHTALPPIIMLLSITIAASSAFMTPLATPANTLAFGAIEKVSLKMILMPGFIMNILAALLTACVFSLLSVFVS